MKAPRWALALTALATAGAGSAVFALPGSAAADETRYNLSARGDAFYFEVNGDEIPVSPRNDAGSLTASAETTNSGGSRGFAGMPYWGNTVQTAPGTVNGVPNQFGLGQVQIPFAVLPGFVASDSNGTPESEEDFGYGRIKSVSELSSATSSASYGAPASIPAPNQQQTAHAATESKGNTVTAVASGSSAGFVSGPLEIGNSTALASISQSVGKPAKIEAKTFGRFSVNGQDFGFDQNGFRYLGQGQDSKQAITQANDVLSNAGIQLDLAPVGTSKDDAGKTTYTIGGLMVTVTQASPTGAGTFTVTYVLGRATVGAVVASLGYGSSNSGTDASAGSRNASALGGSAAGSATDTLPDTQAGTGSGLDAAALTPDLATEAAGIPAAVGTLSEDGTLAPVADGTVATAARQDLPRSLGFVPVAGQTGHNSEWLYAMLVLGGVAMAGGRVLFHRLAVARKA